MSNLHLHPILKKNDSVKKSNKNDNSGNNSGDDPSNTLFSDSEINSDLKENRQEFI